MWDAIEEQTNSLDDSLGEPSKYADSQSSPIERDIPSQSKNSAVKVEKTFGDRIKDKACELWGKLSLYGKFSTIVITLFSLLFLLAFLADKTLSGVIALFSLALVIVALLIKKYHKTSKRWLYIVAVILAIVLIVPYFSTFSANPQSPNSDLDAIIDT